jgi:hypothetical protein
MGLLSGFGLLAAGIEAAVRTDWSSSPWTDVLWLAVVPIGVCAGYVLAWRREIAGALVALGCLLVIYFAATLAGQESAHVPYLYPFGGPALLFVAHWAFARTGGRASAD